LLVERREQRKDDAGARKLAEEWLAFLEDQAAKAPNAEARAAFDSHRVAAALKAGDPARAIPALEQSERDLPGDYNPPNRLAGVYRRLGRLDEALAANGRALAKAYGAPKIGVYQTRAAILEKKGDIAGARKTLQEGLGFAAGLPQGGSVAKRAEALKSDLQKLQ
jgi:tetratricopeptide (TPR) repeat protein